jgi:hypothetical protein
VLFVSIEVMKDWQLEVMLLLNPMSKGTGSWLVGRGVTAEAELAVVEADPDMVDVELVNVELVAVLVAVVAFFSLRGRRSRSPVSCSAASLSGVQAGSARSGPKLARSDADPGSQNSEPSSWVSTICSSIYMVAEENERQHVRNIRKRRWVVWIGR